MDKSRHYVNESQKILQMSDSQSWPKLMTKNRIEELLPFMNLNDLRVVLCQCYDRGIYNQSDIQSRWHFNVWDKKREDGYWPYLEDGDDV